MNIRLLIVPLSFGVLAVSAFEARAQGAFPAPLPGATVQQNDPAFPPVNGSAPRASIGAPSPFPSAGVAPVPGAGPGFAPPQQQAGPPGGADCMNKFMPLREEAEKRGNLIKVASEKHAPPQEACKLIGNFAAAELKMIKYVQLNHQRCGIPEQISDQLKTGHKNTETMLKKVCAVAAQAQQRGPVGPSLSEVLGSAASVPEATPGKKSGGSTFDTLSGNVLTR